MPGEPRKIKGPCFDCEDGAACDCDGAVCSCHLDDTLVLSTQATPKTDDLRPNVTLTAGQGGITGTHQT